MALINIFNKIDALEVLHYHVHRLRSAKLLSCEATSQTSAQ